MGRDSRQVFGYDAAGRLVQVADTVTAAGSAGCTVRRYTFDANSNRTALASVLSPAMSMGPR
ncbi:MAG: hypothetical protein ACOYY2_04995 [Actinomycetota bacterium]